MTRFDLIIFDLDDTLFDYGATERAAVMASCEAAGVTSNAALYSKYREANSVARRSYPTITPYNIERFRLQRASTFLTLICARDLSAERFVALYLEHSMVGVVIPGVPETLEALAGVRKVVATNGTTYPRQQKLAGSTIAKYFDGFFSAETLGIPKSNPDYFINVIKQCDVPRERVLIVGDDYRLDIRAAISIGVESCWFNFRNQRAHAELPKSVTVIEQFRDLVGVVRGRRS